MTSADLTLYWDLKTDFSKTLNEYTKKTILEKIIYLFIIYTNNSRLKGPSQNLA